MRDVIVAVAVVRAVSVHVLRACAAGQVRETEEEPHSILLLLLNSCSWTRSPRHSHLSAPVGGTATSRKE